MLCGVCWGRETFERVGHCHGRTSESVPNPRLHSTMSNLSSHQGKRLGVIAKHLRPGQPTNPTVFLETNHTSVGDSAVYKVRQGVSSI